MGINVLIALYNAFVLPYFTYCCVVWHFCTTTMSDNLQRDQNYAMRIVLKKPPRTSSDLCHGLLGWLTLFQYLCITLLWQVRRCFLHIVPAYLSSQFQTNEEFGYSYTRGKDNFYLCCPKTNFGRNSLIFKGAVLYNSLPPGICHLRNCVSFRNACAIHLFSNCN